MIREELLKDDLYEAVNGEYLDNLEIPGDRSAFGYFAQLDLNVEKTLLNDFKNIELNSKDFSDEMREFVKFYRSVINNKNRELTPDNLVFKTIKNIQNINDKETLNKVLIDLMEKNISVLYFMGVEASFKDASQKTLYMEVPTSILPSKEFYLDEKKKNSLIPVFKEVTTEILNIFGIKNAEEIVNKAVALDEKTIEFKKSSEELADYTKSYNKRTLEEIKEYSTLIDFEKQIKHFIYKELDEISVTQPRFYENLNELFGEDNLEDIKALVLVKFLYNVSDLFDEKLRHLKAKYSNSISGIKEVTSLEKFAYKKGMELYSQTVGLYYGKKYFGEEAKKGIYKLVDDLIRMYQIRLQNKEWLKEATKEKAILKLSTMQVLMGYPDKLPSVYKKMKHDESLSLYENYVTNLKEHVKDDFLKYAEKVDRTEWHMPASMVNAYYSPTSNTICFPAAILQEPFYSLEQNDSQNYAGIGAVIGHEISHSFDNNGAQFDEKGNLNNWWDEEDFKKFKVFQEKMISQFDGIEIYGGKVNGKLVVSENLADVGGVACSLACLKEKEKYDYKEFFMHWCKVWALKGRPEYLQMLLQMDVHAPAKLRGNMQAKNMDEFHESFGTTPEDKMYLPKEDRIIVW